MTVISIETLEYIESPNGNAGAAVATASRGAEEISVIRQRQQPGGFNPPHAHDREEVLVLLAGRIEVTVGDDTHALDAGDAIVIPARAAHQLRTTGDEPAEWLLVAPAGYRFYHASGDEASPAWAR